MAFCPAPLLGSTGARWLSELSPTPEFEMPLAYPRLVPHYPTRSPLENVLRLVNPGADAYVTEKYAFDIELLLKGWTESLQKSPADLSALESSLDEAIEGTFLGTADDVPVRTGFGIEVVRRRFPSASSSGRKRLLEGCRAWLANLTSVRTAEFQVIQIEETSSVPLRVKTTIRYELVGTQADGAREERVGRWEMVWIQHRAAWSVEKWAAADETVARVRGPGFEDVTQAAFSGVESYEKQMLHGTDYWRTVLDGACGIDIYGNNGVSVGDYDNDGFDDIYVCQPSGLPNRLYRNLGNGRLEDVTEKAGVGVLDNTACALFADFENRGWQDLLVVCGTGPLFFRNQGDGTFARKHDAFHFARPPQGTFTHAAVADYDGDGRLDVYFCLYSYYLGLDQYHYPAPYFDARNGPPNYLFHNEGNGSFSDRTEASGLGQENDRYSFACAWNSVSESGLPDLYVVNDFGRSNFYRNKGNGTFAAVSHQAGVDDPGAGMSVGWADIDNDGREDVYVANMWSAAGQRVSAQSIFHRNATDDVRRFYRGHAQGNWLYRDQGDGKFANVSKDAGVAMGRWSWCSDFWDFDHDGYPDLYVTNGYISGPGKEADLGSFFWRQVVGNSPDDITPSAEYEHGWNALNELIRSDHSWSGFERNVLFANNHDGTYSEVSGPLNMDLIEDSRSFALSDLDHDGRLEVIVKNRNSPQLRVLRNALEGLGDAIAFELRGTRSNRDAIGAVVTLESGSLRQTRSLQAGSGFLAQHSKVLFFGLGHSKPEVSATIRWPSGQTQQLRNLPVNVRIHVEEGRADFQVRKFAASSAFPVQSEPSPAAAELPEDVATWLIEPLQAPDLTLADAEGTQKQLRELKGSLALLVFWSTAAPGSVETIRRLASRESSLTATGLKIVFINADFGDRRSEAQKLVANLRTSLLSLYATEDALGVYNILKRYMFDRRRDLSLPTSLLLDKSGMIVRIYQGALQPEIVLSDIRAMPASPMDRIRAALPFSGSLHDTIFQRNDFTYGIALFQHGYLEPALASFEQVIAAKPEDAEAYYNLGTLYLRKENLPQARTYLQQAIRLRDAYPEAWNNMGMVAAQEGHAQDAESAFQKSLALRPRFAIALLNLGNLYRRQERFDQAQRYLLQAHDVSPDDPEVNYGLGMFYAQQNLLKEAHQYLSAAVAARPDYPEARNNLGVLAVREKNYSEAEDQFKAGIELAPTYAQSYFNLARLYALQGDKTRARDVLAQLLQREPDNREAHQALEMLR
jgi:Flp pilus assembly protein TadD/peroxiredoxin